MRYIVILAVLVLSACIGGVQDALIENDGSVQTDTVLVPVPGPTVTDTVYIPVICLIRDHKLRCWPSGKGPVGHLP